jgi:hypothetical protein
MKGSYIFTITVVLLVGIELYQPTSAQNASSEPLSTNATSVDPNVIIKSILDSNLPALFLIVISLVIVVPLLFDMYLAYKREPGEGTGKERNKRPLGMSGLYRSLMSFGILLLVGTVIFYVLALITLNLSNPNTTVLQSLIDLLKSLGTILVGALTAVISFYFGVRGAESATERASTVSPKKEPPSVLSTDPLDGARGVKLDSLVQATFSESMNNQTINEDTFTVKKEGETNPVKGKISLSPDSKTATFDADENFAPDTPYDVTIDINAQDLAGNKLVSAKRWSFTTGAGQ